MYKRIAIAVIAAVAVLGFTASTSVATPTVAQAKTWKHVKIYPNFGTDSACGGLDSTTANFEVNNYPVSGGQIYEWDEDGQVISYNFDVVTYRVYIDGELMPTTQNGATRFNDQTSKHTFKAVWRYGICHPYNTVTL